MNQNVFKPTYLQELCQNYNLSPSKKYGQSFLVSSWPIEKMLSAAELRKTDTVIEIGPGFGALTFALAPAVKKVIAFEIERKLENYWKEKIETEKLRNLEIVWGNALQKISNFKFQISNYKVVANLPYQITSHVLRALLESENKPEAIVVMVQKEVAEKICSKPGDMSLLSVSVQYYGKPEIVAKVSKGNFWPEPAVDSAILKIDLTKPLPFPPLQGEGRVGSGQFFKVVKAGFANKRKQLWKNLAVGLKLSSEKVKSVILEVVGNEKARAEELSVAMWSEIAEKVKYENK